MALFKVLYYPNYIFDTKVLDTNPTINLNTILAVANNPLIKVTMHYPLALDLRLAYLDHGKIYTCHLSHTYLGDNTCMEFCSL